VPEKGDLEAKAWHRRMLRSYEELALFSGRIPPERVALISSRTDMGVAADEIVGSTFVNLSQSQEILETIDVKQRLKRVNEMLFEENRLLEYERDLMIKVRGKLDRNQHEYYLREQMRTIQEELGEGGETNEAQKYRKQLMHSTMPAEIREKVSAEISRFERTPSGSPEAAVMRNWIEIMLELPFGRLDKEHLNLKRAERILDRDHYGLTKVKKRIIEYLAVRKLAGSRGLEEKLKSPIICFAGPPGVGKTSIARSIAEATGRRYTRMSLGGIRDEAEIRGHRKTYIGSMPGRIMKAIHQVGSDNPLFLLDEIDKLGSDYRGDPSSALLEVLDPEQNTNFRDHYLEVPYDLSNVLFITTANAVETIPEPLLDRMEVIEIPGYTEEEKIEIARRHLLPKQLERHALEKGQLTISKTAFSRLIAWYTREAGVRQLEREIAHLCRRAAVEVATGGEEKLRVTVHNLESLLGVRKFRYDEMRREDEVGSATGLAWTFAGGDTLTIEVNVLQGDGKLELTGHLGDVMKESAKAALTYILSRAKALGLKEAETAKKDIHIHVPAGATPKDGPSAGITLATALCSALTLRPVRHNVAMTGEITLRGNVLPVGGLKEKLVAARRAGIETVLVPADNGRDLDEVPETVKKDMKIELVRHMDDVLRIALLPAKSDAK
jgi:ATP-dependent Lon protease